MSSQHFSTFCWRSLLFYNSTATCSVRRGPDVSPREKERKGSVLPASLILLMAARPVRFIQHLVREKLSHRTMASCRVLRWIIHTHTHRNVLLLPPPLLFMLSISSASFPFPVPTPAKPPPPPFPLHTSACTPDATDQPRPVAPGDQRLLGEGGGGSR